MDTQQILRSAFTKAKKNGWNSNGYEYIVLSFDHTSLPPSVIYTKDFAKAFWGEIGCCLYCGKTKDNDSGHCSVHDSIDFYDYPTPIWQYHLRAMVLESDPINYLEKFL